MRCWRALGVTPDAWAVAKAEVECDIAATQRRTVMQCYLLFDSGCSKCAKLVQEVKQAAVWVREHRLGE